VRPDGSLGDTRELKGDADAAPHDAAIAGVMIGRAAYEQPWACLSSADTQVRAKSHLQEEEQDGVLFSSLVFRHRRHTLLHSPGDDALKARAARARWLFPKLT
jgi:tRNA-dihydrouridine synthase